MGICNQYFERNELKQMKYEYISYDKRLFSEAIFTYKYIDIS